MKRFLPKLILTELEHVLNITLELKGGKK